MDATTQSWPTNRADALALGRAIFEPLAPAQKVERAARVLAVAIERVTAPAEVITLLDRVRDPSRWGECHDAFRALRTLTLVEAVGDAAFEQNVWDALGGDVSG